MSSLVLNEALFIVSVIDAVLHPYFNLTDG